MYTIANNTVGQNGTQIILPRVESEASTKLNFFAGPHYEEYKDFNPKRTPQTCEWFLGHTKFQRWRDSRHDDLLWLSADPGCGKSVLSRALIDDSLVGTEATICYFFFKDGNQQQDNCATAMCAMLHQFFSRHKDLLTKYVEPMRNTHGDGLKLRFKLLWQLFVSAATDTCAGEVICIMDALDECRDADRKELCQCLENFYTHPPAVNGERTKIKFFVTSRPYRNIQMSFAKLLRSFGDFRLRAEDQEVGMGLEILRYVQEKVEKFAHEIELDAKTTEALQQRFRKMSHRTYLWAHLMLDELENVHLAGIERSRDLVGVIDRLPESVEDAYEKILARCNKAAARPILEIIIAAEEPLGLSELDFAIQILPGMTTSTNIERENEQAISERLRTVCGLFVQVSLGKVFLIHQTAKEFLIRHPHETAKPGVWRHSITLQEANQNFATICTTRLLFQDAQFVLSNGQAVLLGDRFDDSFAQMREAKRLKKDGRRLKQREIRKHMAKHPFLHYCVHWWESHVREAMSDDQSLLSNTMKLCNPDEEVFQTWTTLANRNVSQNWGSALHCAIQLGFYYETKAFLAQALCTHGPGDWLWEATLAAAKHYTYGKTLLPLFLSCLGTEVMLKETVVEAVASNGGQGLEIMELLLNRYKDQVEITEGVVEAAVLNLLQGFEMLQLLLEKRKDVIKITQNLVNIAGQNLGSGLKITRMLLDDYKDKIDIQKLFEFTALDDFRSAILGFLLDRYKNELRITQRMVERTLQMNQVKAMRVLLDRCEDDVKHYISIEKVMEQAIGYLHPQAPKTMLQLFLDKHEGIFGITPKLIQVADTSGTTTSATSLKSLLDEFQDKLTVTQRAIEFTAGYGCRGQMIMEALLDKHRDEIKITQRVMQAAASNRYWGAYVLKLLLDNQVEVTPGLVGSALGTSENGRRILKLFHDYQIEIAQGPVEESALFSIVDLLE